MVIDIALTRRADGHDVARALQLSEVVVEGNSREGALSPMRQALRERREAGVELVQFDWDDLQGEATSGWPRHSGAFPGDAAYRAMLEEVERERQRSYPEMLP